MQSFFIVAGLLLIVLALGRFIRKRALNKAMPPRLFGETAPDTTLADGSQGQSPELQQAEDLARHLESRISAMKALIGEADERVEKLEELLNRADALASDASAKMKQGRQDEK
jgi:hypothetical protein